MNENIENQDVNEVEGTVTPETKVTTKEVVNVTCPHCQQAFDIEIEKEVHTGTVGRRGKLSGKTLDQMTDDDLKVELINSKSVLYKATKRGAAADVIAKNQERVDAAEAEKAKRAADKVEVTPEAVTEVTPEVTPEAEVKSEDGTVYNEEVENEI